MWSVFFLLALAGGFWSCHAPTHHTTKGSKGPKGPKGFRPYPAAGGRQTLTGYRPRRFALVIGINRYRDPSWHRLRFAAKDARDLSKVLRLFGKFDQITRLTLPHQTTRKALLKAIHAVERRNTDPRDTVLVYISAHGTLARDEEGRLRRYIVTYDAKEKKVAQTALAVDLLRRSFARLKSQRKVLLLATCHSGAGKSRLPPKMKKELKTIKGAFFVKPLETVSRATMILGACGFGETARESPKLKNDIYTHYFMQALKRRYDANNDGAVTVSEAHDYAKDLTYYHTKGQQRPYAESDILGTDPIVLSGKKTRPGKPVLFSYAGRFEGVEVRVNGTAKGSFPKGITLSKGTHRITLVSQNNKKVLFDGPVQFSLGERVDVESLFQRRIYRYGVSLKAGYQSFLQGTSFERFSRPLPLFGLEFKFHRLFDISLELRLEFSFAYNSHKLQEADDLPQTVTELNFGFSVPYFWEIGSFRFFVGPRLSAIYLHRSSKANEHIDTNDFFYSFQPGVLLGLEYRFLQRWSLYAEGRLNYTYVTTENGPSHQGSYEFLGGAYFHF